MTLMEPLDDVEARIVGVLVEKELTTPDGYPLSLNALVNGCNQKSNRDPLTSYTEQTLSEALLRLRLHRLVREVHTAGARVVKYEHHAREVLEVDQAQLAVLTELLLRGPQTPGELRGRVQRMAPMESLEQLGQVISALEARGLLRHLPPLPGSRAARVGHRLGKDRNAPSPGVGASTAEARPAPPAPHSPPAPRSPSDPHSPPAPSAAPMAPPSASAPPAAAPNAGLRPSAHVAAPAHAALEVRVAALEAQLRALAQRVSSLEEQDAG